MAKCGQGMLGITPNDTETSSKAVAVSRKGRVGRLRLEAPGVGNRLNLAVRTAHKDAISCFARDNDIYCAVLEASEPFCSGEDCGELSSSDPPVTYQRLTSAYEGLWQLDRFIKPHVTLIEGFAAWPGLTLALHGTHRVADPNATFSIRDVFEGRPPGWGSSYHLAALPPGLGLYLSLTGAEFDAALAYKVGWLTHVIPASEFAQINELLCRGEPVDSVLDPRDLGPATSKLDAVLPAIGRCFSGSRLTAIPARLEAERGADAAWAERTLAAMRPAPARSRTATHRLLTAHSQASRRDGLVMDFRVAVNWSNGAGEGIDVVFQPPAAGDLDLRAAGPPSIG